MDKRQYQDLDELGMDRVVVKVIRDGWHMEPPAEGSITTPHTFLELLEYYNELSPPINDKDVFK